MMTAPMTVFSFDAMSNVLEPDESPLRWRAGYAGRDTGEPGVIEVQHAVAQAICDDHESFRADAIAAVLAAGETYYESALCAIDSMIPRIHLDGTFLVYDCRHVHGDSDASWCVEPDPDGWYRTDFGWGWYPVPANLCAVVHDGHPAQPPLVVVINGADIDALATAHHGGHDVTWQSDKALPVVVRPAPQ
jgi:hypothetical protein